MKKSLKTFTAFCSTMYGLGSYKTKGSDMQDAYDRLSPKKQNAVMTLSDDETNEEYQPHLYNEYMTWEEYKADQLAASNI